MCCSLIGQRCAICRADAREALEEWQEDYNWRRPHSALANMTPKEFLHRKAMDKMAA
ncbi:integrase core domain-containing protein [Octadecabacter sp. R77987]|uniref:integrase core domain-containing protein n=1 Tax=Octadecabacter sp. R77987 TaxID=3093874 RepID=UPI00366D8234